VGPGSELIGREREIERFRTEVLALRPSGVALIGTPGLGARAIAAHLAELAAEASLATDRIVAHPALRDTPFGALRGLVPEIVDLTSADVVTAVAKGLRTRAGERRLALVVERADALDDLSAAALEQAMVAGEVLPILAVRAGAEQGPAVRSLLSATGMARVHLAPLGRGATERLLANRLGGFVDGRATVTFLATVGGNPQRLDAHLRSAVSAGALVEHAGVWRLAHEVPVGAELVDLVMTELDDRTDAERRVLERLAISGALPLALAGALGPVEEVERLERAGLLGADAADLPSLRVTDPAHAIVLRTVAPATTRRAVGVDLLAEVNAHPAVAVDPIQVQRWRVFAGQPGPPAAVLEAARLAYGASRLPDAEALVRAVPEDALGFDGRLLLGEVLRELGRAEEADAAFAALAPHTEAERAQATMCTASNWYYNLDREQAALDLVAAEAAELGASDWGLEMLGLHGVFLVFSGRLPEAIAEVEPLLAGDGRPFVEAATALGPAFTVVGRCHEALDLTERAFARRAALGDQPILAHAGLHLVVHAFALCELGRLVESRNLALQLHEVAVASAVRHGQAWAALHLTRVERAVGRPQSALRWAREAAAVFDEVGLRHQLRWAYAAMLLSAAQVGDLHALEYASARLDDWSEAHHGIMEPEVRQAHAWRRVHEGDLAGAVDELLGAATLAADTGQLTLEMAVLHDIVRLGQPAIAIKRLTELAALIDSELAPLRVHHASALLADDAGALLEVADGFEARGADLLAGEAAMQAAAARRRAGDPRGAQAAAHRAGAVLRRCEGARTPAAARDLRTSDLTPRERDVAALAAQGWASKRIAAHLDVSVRTVDNMLQRVYRKLGVSRRDELAAVLG
jgi:DNA-binding NarL/FixJ family response regulator